MTDFPPLQTFGRRIMVCGPSNSGKSTLCVALAKSIGVEAFHVDLFRHLPDTNWVQRPDDAFHALHDAAIQQDSWVMDGNYSTLMPQRFARATGVIMLGDNRWANFRRYLWRTLAQKQGRAGSLAGDRDSIKWEVINWILFVQPPKREADRARVRDTGLPLLELNSMTELNHLYAAWGLNRDLGGKQKDPRRTRAFESRRADRDHSSR